MKSLLSHSGNRNDLSHFLKNKILEAFGVSSKKIITVCGTKTESTNTDVEDPRDHDHEEADTLIVYHCLQAAEDNPGSKIKVHSIGTDVYLLHLSIAHDIQTDHLYMVVGRGRTKREINIIERALILGKEKCQALLGLHAFTGADWGGKFASISKKSWIKAFLNLEDSNEIVYALASLGSGYQKPNDEVCCILEKFVCMVYSPKSSKYTLEELRWELFRLKSKEGEKLPPTRASFCHIYGGQTI